MAIRSPTWRSLSTTPVSTSGVPRPSLAPVSETSRLLRRALRPASRRTKKPPAATLTEISAMAAMVRMVWKGISMAQIRMSIILRMTRLPRTIQVTRPARPIWIGLAWITSP